MTTKKTDDTNEPNTREPTEHPERATRDEDPEASERAASHDAPVELQRVDIPDASDVRERAVPADPTVKAKRAKRSKAPVSEERADLRDATVSPTRADPDEAPEAIKRTPEQDRMALKRKVRMMYDLQRLRLQAGGRTLARPTKPGSEEKVEIFLHEVDLAILEARAKDLRRVEREALRDVETHLNTIPFYRDILSDKELYKGIGPTMAGVILSEFDIYRADTVSKMWKFAGLTSTPADRCRRCYSLLDAEHAHRGKTPKGCEDVVELPEDRVASGEAPRPKKGEKLPYNAFLRVKLVGVLGPVLIKVGSPWRKVYDDYKLRLQSKGWGRNDGHRHQASIRYMIKMLLNDIHRRWRTHEGLVLREPYAVEKLGMAPHSSAPFQPGPKEERPAREEHSLDEEIAAELEALGIAS